MSSKKHLQRNTTLQNEIADLLYGRAGLAGDIGELAAAASIRQRYTLLGIQRIVLSIVKRLNKVGV